MAVTIRNRGGAPAGSVTVEGELSGTGEPERSSVTVDYLPERSARAAGLYFSGVPTETSLRFRVLGYVRP